MSTTTLTTWRAAERWGRDTFRALSRGELTAGRARALFAALTPQARIHLVMELAACREELAASPRPARRLARRCRFLETITSTP